MVPTFIESLEQGLIKKQYQWMIESKGVELISIVDGPANFAFKSWNSLYTDESKH